MTSTRLSVCVLVSLSLVGGCRKPVPCKEYAQLRSALGALPGFGTVIVTPISTDSKRSSFSATIVHGGVTEKTVLDSIRKHLANSCPWFQFKSDTPYGFDYKGYYYDVWFIYRAKTLEARVYQSFAK